MKIKLTTEQVKKACGEMAKYFERLNPEENIDMVDSCGCVAGKIGCFILGTYSGPFDVYKTPFQFNAGLNRILKIFDFHKFRKGNELFGDLVRRLSIYLANEHGIGCSGGKAFSMCDPHLGFYQDSIPIYFDKHADYQSDQQGRGCDT